MEYRWNPGVMTRVFALPAAVVDEHIRLAGAKQLKVLLWLSCHGEGRFDAEACAAAIGGSPADCGDALQYWVECGLLLPAEAATSRPASPVRAPAEPPVPPTAPAPAPRPRAVKPQFKDVLARQKENESFAGLLQDVSARLGRPITHGDMETLLYLFDTAGLPAEVILMVVGYAVAAGKLNMRYVEKVALDWADRGIDTIPAAEQYLCDLEKRDAAASRVRRVLGLERPLTAGQAEMAQKWLTAWHMPDELLRLAAALCAERTGKFNAAYVDKVLEGWHLDGIDTKEKAEAAQSPKKGRAKSAALPVEDSSLDLDEYEKRVLHYVPVFETREKKEGEGHGL